MANREIEIEPVRYEPPEGKVIKAVVLHGAFFQCTKCGALKEATEFGNLRMMEDGIVRNHAQCSDCR